MNRLLTSVSLASLLLLAVPARAELQVTLGGYVGFQAAVFDNDAANNSNRDFQSESEIHVKVKGLADNGLEYGALIELRTSVSDSQNTDEANLWLSNRWGRFELGDQDGAGSELAELTPYVGIGQVRGSYIDFVTAADRGHSPSEAGMDSNLKAIDTADATKVTYYTPRLQGFQAGISYAPERDSSASGEVVQFLDNTGNHDNAIELGLNYMGELSGLGIKVGGQYTHADTKSVSTLEDISAWSLGTQLTYNSFTLGGGYTHNGDSGQAAGVTRDNVTGWNVGATYSSGPWGVGISYASINFDNAATPFGATGATGAGGDYTVYGVGGVYKIAPGLTAAADIVVYDRNRVTGTDTNGYVAITEIRAAF